jgi:hypothetical protein
MHCAANCDLRRGRAKKVILVNPVWSQLGYNVITPRWPFVIAAATPRDQVGDPILIDEVIT